MTDNAKDLRLRELKDTITELNTLVKTLRETIEMLNKREAELQQERDILKEKVDYLTKKLFGSSSEKRPDDFPGQLSLFNEAEAFQDPQLLEEEEAEAVCPPKPKTRKKKATQKETFAGLPVRKAYIREKQTDCDVCGTPLEVIGEEFHHRELEFQRPRVTVVEYYSRTYKCPECEKQEDLKYISKDRDRHIRRLHGMASAGTVAWVMYQKFCNCVPFYRQEKDWQQYGARISRNTMANWVNRNAKEFFAPMCRFFRNCLLQNRFLMADETPVQVLKELERKAQAKSYMWIYRTGETQPHPVILYRYSQTRAGSNAADFLDGFTGYLMCDGYSGYNKVTTAKRCACWAHIRRYLMDAIPKGKQHDYNYPAVQGVMYVNRLFDLEKEIHKKHSRPEAIKKARLEKEKPVLEGFWTWLEKQSPMRGTRMDKAVTYIRNQKKYLETYLEDGNCSFSNNASERSVKPFVMGRKNWLFYDTPEGAEASEMVYTVIETAKANGVNVYHYLRYLLEQGPSPLMSDEELERYAPWNEEVRKEIERRIQEEAEQE